jgi:hypothetical protein
MVCRWKNPGTGGHSELWSMWSDRDVTIRNFNNQLLFVMIGLSRNGRFQERSDLSQGNPVDQIELAFLPNILVVY